MSEFYFAQKAFILNKGFLLVVRKSLDDPNQPGKWEVPGGRMEFGEELDSHLIREVHEEVGIKVTPGKPFHIWQWRIKRKSPTKSVRDIQIVAVARICKPHSLLLDHSNRVSEDYLDESAWVEIPKLLSINWIDNMIPVVKEFISLANMKDQRLIF